MRNPVSHPITRRAIDLGAITIGTLGTAAIALGSAAGPATAATVCPSTATVIAPAMGDPRFQAGSVGPAMAKGAAPTLTIPDGLGFGGERGRRQNRGDLRKDNYSVTDANFNNELGLLAKNPDTGAPMNYVEDIQTYAAAGFLQTFAPSVYATLAANQNAGRGTVLGGAAHLMGLVSTADRSETGAKGAAIPVTLPGTPLVARAVVRSPQDITGQNWARMHHAESSFGMYRSLAAAGIGWQQAMILSGDDGVSGAGRLNGVNTQDGKTGFDRDELTVYELGAQLQRTTGKPVVSIMMTGHHMDTGQMTDALTKPHVNRLIGIAKDDRSMSSTRIAALYRALVSSSLEPDQKPGQPTGTMRRPALSTIKWPIATTAPHLAKFQVHNAAEMMTAMSTIPVRVGTGSCTSPTMAM